MVITFFLPQFKSENFPLQPWLTVYQLGDRFVKHGHKVDVITDVQNFKCKNGIKVHSVKSLWGTNKKEIKNVLNEISPDIAIISVTPFSLLTSLWYSEIKKNRLYAFLSYPIYNFSEIKRAVPYLTFSEIWSYGRNLLVPKYFWGMKFNGFFNGIFCQSENTGRRIRKQIGRKTSVHVIPPGIDKEEWKSGIDFKKREDQKTVFLYTGGISKIRGLPIILDAFKKVCMPEMQLRILVRGAGKEQINEIEEGLSKHSIPGKIDIKGGWLDTNELKNEIRNADAVLLPFILVPAELPVTAMEVIACGTPAIVSDIDGLPDAVGNAGIVVAQANTESLADAMLKVHNRKGSVEQFGEICMKQWEKMATWDTVASQWLDVFREN